MILLVGNASAKLYHITFDGRFLCIRLKYQRYENISFNYTQWEMGYKSLPCMEAEPALPWWFSSNSNEQTITLSKLNPNFPMVLDILLLKSCSWVDELSFPVQIQIPLAKNPQRLVILEFNNFESINKFFLWGCLYHRTEETKEAERFYQTREGQKSHERVWKNPVSQAFSCHGNHASMIHDVSKSSPNLW